VIFFPVEPLAVAAAVQTGLALRTSLVLDRLAFRRSAVAAEVEQDGLSLVFLSVVYLLLALLVRFQILQRRVVRPGVEVLNILAVLNSVGHFLRTEFVCHVELGLFS